MERRTITKEECQSNMKTIMEEIKGIATDVKNLALEVAGLPEKMAVKFDERYAGKDYERRINLLVDKVESRNYDWLKFAIVTAISTAILILTR